MEKTEYQSPLLEIIELEPSGLLEDSVTGVIGDAPWEK